MGLAADLIGYVGGLTLAGGDHDGEPFEVLPWERRFVRGAFKVRGDAALSVARGNGKSGLVGALACAVVDPDGPLNATRAEVVCVAASFAQAQIIFEDVKLYLGVESSNRTWRVNDTANNARIEHRATGARIRCLGANPATMHGIRPKLVLADEPAQWEQAKADRALAALRTSLGKVPGSRLIALGTQPDGEGHWFSRLLRTADYSQAHVADPDAPPFRVATIRRANPSYDHLPSLRERIRLEAAEARQDATLLPSFKALRLNLGTPDTERAELIEAATWAGVETQVAIPEGRYALGVDLGSGAAMCAASGYWPDTGRLSALAVFPSVPSLAERGVRDGVGNLYQRMAKAGELLVVPGTWVPVDVLLTEVKARWGFPSAIAADRWREAELRQGLSDAGFPLAGLTLRGQGFRDGAEDVREFRRAVLGGEVAPAKSLLLRSGLSGATVVSDTSGNEKLAKGSQNGRRARHRDDSVASAILAVAEGRRRGSKPERSGKAGHFVVR